MSQSVVDVHNNSLKTVRLYDWIKESCIIVGDVGEIFIFLYYFFECFLKTQVPSMFMKSMRIG